MVMLQIKMKEEILLGTIILTSKPCNSERITSPYGKRGGEYHCGIDIGEDAGKDIWAAHAGTVVAVRWDAKGYGNYIVLQSLMGFCTLYAHLSKALVKVGDKVGSKTVIGLCGSTGNSSGPHLHFEVRITEYGSPGWWDKDASGKRINSVDPLPYLKAIGKIEEKKYILSVEDANKLINLLKGVFSFVEDKAKATETENEIHRLANELRKASGQPIA
jgi:murein DD-endopeptidase MepM/ murein hydrolase activator NlpD